MIKKLFFLGIVLSAFLCACTTEDTGGGETENQQQLEVGFSPYISRSTAQTTRTTVMDNSTLGQAGVGVFAMYSKDSMFYSKETSLTINGFESGNKTFPTKTSFVPNFMKNIKVWNKNNDGAWTYNQTRYWPMNYNEFISFLAYGPYDASVQLYTKKVTTTGEGEGATKDSTYTTGGGSPVFYKYDVSNMKDLVWNTNNTWNMGLVYQGFIDGKLNTSNNYQYGPTQNGERGDDYWKPSNTTLYNYSNTDQAGNVHKYYEVKLNMAHATSRLAYVITCPALENDDNYGEIPEGSTSVESGAQITVDTLVLLGDAKSGRDNNPKGIFIKSGYLNLAGNTATTQDNKQNEWAGTTKWEGLSSEKVSFSFYNFNSGTMANPTSENKLMWRPGTEQSNVIKGTKDNNGKINVNYIGNASDSYLYIIPQDLRILKNPGYTQEELQNYYRFMRNEYTFPDRPLYCYIAYTVKYKDGTSGKVAEDGIHYNGYGFFNCNFEPGQAYVLYIQIGRSDGGSTSNPRSELNAIHFGVKLADWPEEDYTIMYGGNGNRKTNL